MLDCSICFENVVSTDDMIKLECRHELCRRCVKKLQRLSCPYCRCDITKQIKVLFEQQLKTVEYKPIAQLIRINLRRIRRRRRSREERLADRQSIVLNPEEVEISIFEYGRKGKYKKNKRGKPHIDRKKQKYKQSRRCRWTGLNRQRHF